jgi:dolichol-phosphate mannosyltransferase
VANLHQVRLSIVVPCFNEEVGLGELHRRATAAARSTFGDAYELILVDDGSTDATWTGIRALAAKDPRVVAVRLARNHGHQLALTAGLSEVAGELVLVVDADLQDPPELVGPMYDVMVREGADVVYGQRRSRSGESGFKKKSATVFYRVLAKLTKVAIPMDTGDFRLMNRNISNILNAMPEHDRFIRGMVAWLGFKQVPFLYDREARFAGTTKYPLRKMIGLAIDALVSFSMVPLRVATYVGAILALGLIFAGLYVLGSWLVIGTTPGWASLTLLVVATSAVQLFVLGLIGEYVGRIYIQTKQRPLYLIAEVQRAQTIEGNAG